MKLVGYLRGPKYEEQMEKINKHSKPVKFYLDKNGVGSRVSDRKSYLKMLDDYNTWDTLIVSSLEVLHTDIRNIFDFLAFLLAYKKRLICIKENIDDDGTKGFLMGAYSLKQIYDTDSGNYVPRVTAQKAHLNTWIGRPPYGYRIMNLDDDKKVLVPREAEALVVELIFSRRAKGDSYKGISEYLNSKGIPATQKGKRWTYVKVMRILDNKIYWGYRDIYDDMGEKMWVRHDYPTIIDESLGRKTYMVRASKKERKK
jgi:DNA invertase Pin-like site-specific DNA recombinase